jgi:hypothetical protein
MKHLFTINTEGGPLLCFDAGCGRNWQGSESPSSDYKNLCAIFDSSPEMPATVVNIGGCHAVAWETSGAGSADVFRGDDARIRVVRAWVDDDTRRELEKLASADASTQVEIGDVEIPSGIVALMWSPESGQRIPLSLEQGFQRVPGTSLDDSAWVLRATKQRYRCYHDEVAVGKSQARRLTLIPL